MSHPLEREPVTPEIDEFFALRPTCQGMVPSWLLKRRRDASEPDATGTMTEDEERDRADGVR